MTHTIKTSYLAAGAIIVLAFGVFAAMPAKAMAQYDGDYGYDDSGYSSYDSGNYDQGGYDSGYDQGSYSGDQGYDCGCSQSSYPPVTYVNNPAPIVYHTPAPVVYNNPAPIIYNNPAPIVYNNPAPIVYNTTPVYNYQPPVQQYSPLQVSCYPMPLTAQVGTSVTWYASAYGGNGSYNYTWNGNDGLSAYGQSVSYVYRSPGYKNASVTVISGGQSISQNCSGSINVTGVYYAPPTYYPPAPVYAQPVINQYPVYAQPIANNSGLDVGCYADPAKAVVNQPINWTVEVTGGAAPYTYSWTGTDGLYGNQSSITKYYQTTGEKSAIVSVTSADGRTSTKACSVTENIRSSVAPAAPAKPVVAPATTGSQLSAASFFSLQSIPWGWVAFLIILVLFAMVMYLVFNRPKI